MVTTTVVAITRVAVVARPHVVGVPLEAGPFALALVFAAVAMPVVTMSFVAVPLEAVPHALVHAVVGMVAVPLVAVAHETVPLVHAHAVVTVMSSEAMSAKASRVRPAAHLQPNSPAFSTMHNTTVSKAN